MLGSPQMGTGIIDVLKKAGEKIFGTTKRIPGDISERIFGPLVKLGVKIVKQKIKKAKEKELERHEMGFPRKPPRGF